MKNFGKGTLLCACAVAASAQFPTFHKPAAEQKLTLTRKVPALVDFTGRSIKLDVTFSDKGAGDYRMEVNSKLATLLAGHEGKGVRIAPTENDGVLTAAITSAEMKQEKGPSTGLGKLSGEMWIYKGDAEIHVVLTDSKGNPLESDDSKYHYTRRGYKVTAKFGIGLHDSSLSPHDQAALLADGTAHKIARFVVNLDDKFEVILPAGNNFEPVRKLLLASKWGAALEAIERLEVDSKDQVAKEYLIGVANEALGYADKEPAKVVDFLDQADKHYAAAVEKKSDYKEASDADDRVKDSREYFMTIESKASERQKALETLKQQDVKKQLEAKADEKAREEKVREEKQPKPEPVVKSSPAPPEELKAEDEGRNKAIIYLKQSGSSDAVILNYIKTTPNPHYDIGARGLAELSRAGVSQQIIEALQLKMKQPAPKRTGATQAKK